MNQETPECRFQVRTPTTTIYYSPSSLLGLAREIRLHHIYPYILPAQVHVRHCPAKIEYNGLRVAEVTWKPCQSCIGYPGLCANPPWAKPCKATQGADTLTLIRTCKAVATEIKAVIFEQAVICIDMRDVLHLYNLNMFGRITRISLHGLMSHAKRLIDEAVGFASNSEHLFHPAVLRAIFPRVKKVSFHILNDNKLGLPEEDIVNAVRTVAWEPEVEVAKVHLTKPQGTETSIFTKKAVPHREAPCLQQDVLITHLGEVHYSNTFFISQRTASVSHNQRRRLA